MMALQVLASKSSKEEKKKKNLVFILIVCLYQNQIYIRLFFSLTLHYCLLKKTISNLELFNLFLSPK